MAESLLEAPARRPLDGDRATGIERVARPYIGFVPRSSVSVDSSRVRRLVESLDTRVDAAFEPLRGRPLVDGLASAASFLGDHGLAWFVLCLLRARSPSRRSTALRALVYTGALAPPLNAALKSAFGRVRPPTDGARHGFVRIPRTSSFPSGHTLAAWCAATMLADGDPLAPAYYGLAVAISLSRVHLRVHHASDVAAGALLGVTLGRAGRIRRRP